MYWIKAKNPRGVDFDYMADTTESARKFLRNIISMGGEEIMINGRLVTPEQLARLTA